MNMEVETINALEKAIKEKKILKKYNLERIGIFGSFSRGERAKDIDFYIDSDNYDIKNLVGLKNDLEKICKSNYSIPSTKGHEICHPMKKMIYCT